MDVFVRDRWLGTVERVSVDSAGAQGNWHSGTSLCMSADARFVSFASLASNLVGGDTNGAGDVFVRVHHAVLWRRELGSMSVREQRIRGTRLRELGDDGRRVAGGLGRREPRLGFSAVEHER